MNRQVNANWLEGIEYVRGLGHDKRYIGLRYLREGDSILHLEVDGKVYVGIYAELKIEDVRSGAIGHIYLEFPDDRCMEIKGQARKVWGHRYRLTLGSEVTFFEFEGSLCQEISKANREAGKKGLVDAYLEARKG